MQRIVERRVARKGLSAFYALFCSAIPAQFDREASAHLLRARKPANLAVGNEMRVISVENAHRRRIVDEDESLIAVEYEPICVECESNHRRRLLDARFVCLQVGERCKCRLRHFTRVGSKLLANRFEESLAERLRLLFGVKQSQS